MYSQLSNLNELTLSLSAIIVYLLYINLGEYMVNWIIWCYLGVILAIIELFAPALFFLNLAIAAFLTSIPAYFGASFAIQTIIFLVLSTLLLFFIRPFLVNKTNNGGSKHSALSEYIGKTAKVIEDVAENVGRISIYDENWEARSIDKSIIPKGTIVKIRSFDNLIMYVEKENI
jgi:membrane protein implicated in regulation of membrane protease activity